jgi:hypothetical protein
MGAGWQRHRWAASEHPETTALGAVPVSKSKDADAATWPVLHDERGLGTGAKAAAPNASVV